MTFVFNGVDGQRVEVSCDGLANVLDIINMSSPNYFYVDEFIDWIRHGCEDEL